MVALISSFVEWINDNQLVKLFVVIGPLTVLVAKNYIENYNNLGIEHKLTSNLARFSVSVFLYSVMFVVYSILVYFMTIETTDNVDWIYGVSILITSGLITTAYWFGVKLAINIFLPKYDYYLDYDNTRWLLLKNNSKKGSNFQTKLRKREYLYVCRNTRS